MRQNVGTLLRLIWRLFSPNGLVVEYRTSYENMQDAGETPVWLGR